MIESEGISASPVYSFNEQNQTVSDKEEIANKFNNYFINIGPKLANYIPDSTSDYMHFLGERNSKTMCIDTVTPSEILNILSNLRNSVNGEFLYVLTLKMPVDANRA